MPPPYVTRRVSQAKPSHACGVREPYARSMTWYLLSRRIAIIGTHGNVLGYGAGDSGNSYIFTQLRNFGQARCS